MQAFRSMCLFAALAVPCSAFATPITYTFTAVGSGTFGSTSFFNAAITFTEVADTDNIINHSGDYFSNAGNVHVTIGGVGSTGFGPSVSFVAEPSGSFGVFDNKGGALFLAIDPAFSTYLLDTSFGPTAGTFGGGGNGLAISGTTADLDFSFLTDAVGSATLAPTVAATPEPSSIALLGTGMLGVFALARRRFGTSPA